jgi:hypothetical protein
MRAIQVRYLGPTNFNPSRWKAFAYGGFRILRLYDYEKNEMENARAAAEQLILRFKLDWKIASEGVLPNGDYVFIVGA